ncbi:unnamed protein product [Moneuplotes crassus]|uniref:Uncharacterized protein n=1 Tax=Euplotes crassus TaxID=5936 RepID=A0AAD1XJF4_EUPCR|nr:unnamed protein product [Moneuplotes crassus]
MLEYTTRRIVILNSYALGILYRLCQLLIILYFIIYVFIVEERYKRTIVYPINLSTRIIGSQVLQDSNGDTLYVDAQDITSVDQAQTNSFNFGINITQEWQARSNCATGVECTVDDDCSGFLNGACHNGNCTSFQWCTRSSRSYTIDLFQNFLLEIRGVVCETLDEGEQTECHSSFNYNITSDTDILGSRYGSDVISVRDIINNLPNARRGEDFMLDESQIIYISYIWDCETVDEGCDSEMKIYTVPKVTYSNETYLNQGYQYLRNVSAGPEPSGRSIDIHQYPLIRMKSTVAGLRFVIQGWNTHDETLYALIAYYVGLCFILLASIHHLFDLFILWLHPNKENIIQAKFNN